MHELSIALGIVELAEREAIKAKASTIETIELEIGELSGVEIEALEFAWPVAVEGTMLEKAKKIIDKISGKAKCLECENLYDINNLYDSCPKCKSHFKDIYKGKELRVKSISVGD